MMWGLLIAGITFITAIIFSMGKISKHGDNITASHRKELLSRKKDKEIIKDEAPKE